MFDTVFRFVSGMLLRSKTVTRFLFLQILIRNRATDLDARMHDGTTPLILAARLAVEGMVEELINCHADVNAIDDFGKVSLFYVTVFRCNAECSQTGMLDLITLFLSPQVNQLYIGLQQ